MNTEIIYRPMNSLDDEEKIILRTLTLEDFADGRRSLVRRWLDKYSNQEYFHTAIVYSNRKIIGWAAANMVESWNNGMIGVFIKQEYRRNGYAKQALEILLPKLKEIYPEWPEYLVYMKEKEKLFSHLVEIYGFKDYFKNIEEYNEKQRKAISGISD